MLTDEYTISEIEGLLAAAPLVVGMRLYSFIVAAAHGTSIAAISYHPKCEAVLNQLEVEDWLNYADIEVNKSVSIIQNGGVGNDLDARVGDLQQECHNLFNTAESLSRRKYHLPQLSFVLPLAILSARLR